MKKIIVLLACIAVLCTSSAMGATLYINQSMAACNNSHTYAQAQTWTTPWCDLTNINNFSSGDTVYLCNGTYRVATTVIVQDKAINAETYIRNYPGETAIMTTAMSDYETVPNTRWCCVNNPTCTIHRTCSASSTSSTEWNFVDGYGTTLMSYGVRGDFATYSDFSNLNYPTGLWYNETSGGGDDRIFIRLNSSSYNPNATALYISKSNAVLDFQNITGSASIHISGLTFRNAKYAITTTLDTDYPVMNLTIESNTFTNIYMPILVQRGGNITIRYNNFTTNRQSDWFWRIYKADILGDTDMEGSAIKWDQNDDDYGWIYSNNMRGSFNGVLLYNTASGDGNYVKVYNNNFTDIADDALEPEGYGCDNDIYGNIVRDTFVALSAVPFDSTLCTTEIYSNILHGGKNVPYSSLASYTSGKSFKLQGGGANKVSNLYIHNNDFVSDHSGSALVGAQSSTSAMVNISNVTVIDNIFITNNSYIMDWNGNYSYGNLYDYNIWFRRLAGSMCRFYGTNQSSTAYSSLANCMASPVGLLTGWDGHSWETDPFLTDYAGGNYTPSSLSIACSWSSTSSYIGALPCPAPGTPLTVTINYPTNNTNLNYVNSSIIFTVSASATCTINDSRFNRRLPASTPGTTYHFQYDPTFPYDYTDVFPEGHYNVEYRCTDGAVWNNGTIEFSYTQVSGDAYVEEANPATNHGATTTVEYGIDGAGIEIGLVLVNYSGLPLSINVTEATMYLSDGASLPTYITDVYVCTDGVWNEDTITWADYTTQIDMSTCTLLLARDCGVATLDSINLSAIAASEVYSDRMFTVLVNGTNNCWMDLMTFDSSEGAISTAPWVDIEYEALVTPPVVTQIDYYDTLYNPNITFTTNSPSTCKYGTTDVAYTSMPYTASGTNTSHWLNLSTMVAGNNSLYIACNDTYGNWANSTQNHDGWVYISDVHVYFFDIDSGAAVTLNLNLTLAGTTYYSNTNTTLGSISYIGTGFDDFQLSIRSQNYSNVSIFFTLSEGERENLTIYLQSATTTGTYKIVKVVDENLNPIEGALVEIFKETTPSVYVSLGYIEMNFEGENAFAFTENTVNYKFDVYYEGTLIKSSEATFVSSSKTTITLQCSISSDQLESLRIAGAAYRRLTLVNDSGNMRYDFTYSGTDIRMARLDLFKSTLASDEILVGTNESVGATGTLSVSFTPEAGWTYRAKGWLDTNTNSSWYMSAIGEYRSDPARAFGFLGLMIAFLLIVTLAFMSADNPQMQVVFAVMAIIVIGIVGIMDLTTSVILLIAGIAAVIVFRSRT